MKSVLLVVLTSLAALCACSPGKRPLLIIQMCVNDDQGVADFMRIMRSIAVSEQMTFVDGGERTQQELKTVGAKDQKLDTPGSVIDFGLERGGDSILMGGNLGLPEYQIAIGFSGADPPKEVLRLADVVEKRLSARWQVLKVPNGTGALPMPTCPGKN
jgi:hypothetical protein